MLTITAKLQYDQCRKDINKLLYEQSVIANQIEITASRLDKMESACGDNKDALADLKKTAAYQDLAAYDSSLDSRKESIETELELLNAEMDNFEKLHQQGIQESTTFWCFGG